MGGLRSTVAFLVVAFVLLPTLVPQAQSPATPWTLLTREGRRAVATVDLNGQELMSLDELAALFQLALNDDTGGGNTTLTYRGRTIVLSANQSAALVNGRAVSMSSPVVRSGRRWLVPPDFLQSALGPIYDQRIQVRRAARVVILGDLRVPRVSARIDSTGPPTRVLFEITPASRITTTQDGPRVVVRVDADALDLTLPAGEGLVQQIRAGEQPNTIVLMLEPGAGAIRAASNTAGTMARLTIDVQEAAAPLPDSPEPQAVPRPAPAGPATPLDPSAWLAPRRLRTVVIDPGHGGADAGVRGAGGTIEKLVALDIARRLRMLLETRQGLRVILTRDNDVAVTLDARAATANNSRADLFVSLHLNGAPSPQVAGAEVYYLHLDREGELARQQAAETAIAVPVAGGGSRTIEIARWDLAQARHVDASTRLATIIAEDLGRDASRGSVTVRRAPIRVLEGINMPAALVEIAYLTNRPQEKLATSAAFKDGVAEALHDAVVRFKRQLEEGEAR
jgi:N-acetylmuramoyl-L-alanine amidase